MFRGYALQVLDECPKVGKLAFPITLTVGI